MHNSLLHMGFRDIAKSFVLSEIGFNNINVWVMVIFLARRSKS